MEVGKKYRHKVSGQVFTCVGHRLSGNPLTESAIYGISTVDLSRVKEFDEVKGGSFWLNIYTGSVGGIKHQTRERADGSCNHIDKRIACIEVKYEEGEGL